MAAPPAEEPRRGPPLRQHMTQSECFRSPRAMRWPPAVGEGVLVEDPFELELQRRRRGMPKVGTARAKAWRGRNTGVPRERRCGEGTLLWDPGPDGCRLLLTRHGLGTGQGGD